MKSQTASHVFTYIIALLILGNPPLISQAENLTATERTHPDIINAKADAIRDAKADVNPFAWFTAGCLLSYTSVVLAGTAYSKGSITSEMRIPAALCVSTLGLAIHYYSPRPDPPTNRFIGKTPQYVEMYIATYKIKSRNRQTLLATAGFANGCLTLSAFTVGLTRGLMAFRPE